MRGKERNVYKNYVVFNGKIRIYPSSYSKEPQMKKCEIMIPKNQFAFVLQKMLNKKITIDALNGESLWV
jgi:hypothetical protein